MNGLLADPQKLSMLLSGMGLLTSKYEDQADKWKAFGARGLLSGAETRRAEQEKAAEIARMQPMDDANLAYIKAQTEALRNPTAKNRKIVKGADGRNYYADTQQPVLPGVSPSLNPEKLTDYEFKLRKEYNDQSKEFIKQSHAYNRVVKSAQDPSGAGDLALIFNYMKILDPGSTVREGEFATAQNTGGMDDKIVSLYNQLVRGERLSHKQRADFVDRSGRLYQGAVDFQGVTDTRYKNLADTNKINPENILFSPGFDIYQYPQELIDSEEGGRNEVEIDGVTYIEKDGGWYKK